MIAGLPGCPAAATVRVEAYSAAPGAGMYGSLDASVYVCEAHASSAADAVRAAGLSPYRAHTIRDGLVCGQVFDYTTMRLTAAPARPAPVQHPVWCDRQLCTVTGETGEHRSRPLDTTPRGERALAGVRLWMEAVPADALGATTAAGTYVLADLEQSGERRTYLVGVGQAAVVARLLRRMVELARAGA